ncbi:MAG TPA: tetratricopeptide repeat protein [Spirochaetota bacterium]|nr:tetratricopeptide repeat protein [Spirochaetota bacterium]
MSQQDINQRIRKFLNLALESFGRRDYDAAIETLKSAEVLDENNPEILYNLGVSYCRTGLYHTAISYFEKLMNLPFTTVDIITTLKLLSFSYIKTADYSAALDKAREGSDISPADTTLLNLTGYCFEKMEKFPDAIRIYKRILEIDGNNSNACNALAFILAKTGSDLTSALQYAQKALKLKPDNPAYLDTAGYIYMKRGNNDTAKKLLKKAYAKMPESEEIREHINELLDIDDTP